MIKATVTRNNDNSIHRLVLEIDSVSLVTFHQALNKALNCWDTAPAELKELADCIAFGAPLQQYPPDR